MVKFFQLMKEVMAILGCVFCILIAVKVISDPFFSKRTMGKNEVEMCDMEMMCAKIELAAREFKKGKEEQGWESFLATNSYCISRGTLPRGQFYNVAQIINPDANAWDFDKETNRVPAYFVVWDDDGIKVWKMSSVAELRQMPKRLWTKADLQKLFEIFDRVYGEENSGDTSSTAAAGGARPVAG